MINKVYKNKDVYSICKIIADDKNVKFPIFINGKAGTGKTHFLKTIERELVCNYNLKKIKYVTCEEFIEDFVISVENSTMDYFRYIYDCNDVLLFDGIDRLVGKKETQYEVYERFRNIINNNKQIVVASNAPISKKIFLEPLLSIFRNGIFINLNLSNISKHKSRFDFINKKVNDMDIKCKLDTEVINYIVNNTNSDVRKIEGSIYKLVNYSITNNKKVNLNEASELLRDII